jgi:O-6-methylguanine DNA methyltransferase
MTLSRVLVNSPFGSWCVEGDDDGITRIYLPHDRQKATDGSVAAPVKKAAKQLEEYFAKKRTHFDVDLHLDEGTSFQHDVWMALAKIPYGEVRTYGDVATKINHPNAYRAVGNANAANPWPIVVPCHRVVATSGMGGYAGGLDVKRALLELEGVTL